MDRVELLLLKSLSDGSEHTLDSFVQTLNVTKSQLAPRLSLIKKSFDISHENGIYRWMSSFIWLNKHVILTRMREEKDLVDINILRTVDSTNTYLKNFLKKNLKRNSLYM